MRKVSLLLAVLALSALVVPAGAAGWTSLSTSFVGTGTGLVTDTSTDTLYGIKGNTIKSYNAGTDTWNDLTASTFGGYAAGDNDHTVTYVGGKIVLKGHNESYVEIYDIATDSWSQNNLPTAPSGNYSHSQGSTYDTSNGVLQCLWTVFPAGGGEKMAVAGYDVATGTWSAVTEYNWPDPAWFRAHWGGKASVQIGTTDYILDDTDTTPSFKTYDFTTGTFPEPTTGRTAAGDLGTTDLGGVAQVWGQQLMAVSGTDIYVTGADMSGEFAVYHTLTDTWENLDSYTNGGGGYRDHNTAVAGGVVYVQDGNEFFAYVPEPATMSLLGLGGLGLLLRRKR